MGSPGEALIARARAVRVRGPPTRGRRRPLAGQRGPTPRSAIARSARLRGARRRRRPRRVEAPGSTCGAPASPGGPPASTGPAPDAWARRRSRPPAAGQRRRDPSSAARAQRCRPPGVEHPSIHEAVHPSQMRSEPIERLRGRGRQLLVTSQDRGGVGAPSGPRRRSGARQLRLHQVATRPARPQPVGEAVRLVAAALDERGKPVTCMTAVVRPAITFHQAHGGAGAPAAGRRSQRSKELRPLPGAVAGCFPGAQRLADPAEVLHRVAEVGQLPVEERPDRPRSSSEQVAEPGSRRARAPGGLGRRGSAASPGRQLRSSGNGSTCAAGSMATQRSSSGERPRARVGRTVPEPEAGRVEPVDVGQQVAELLGEVQFRARQRQVAVHHEVVARPAPRSMTAEGRPSETEPVGFEPRARARGMPLGRPPAARRTRCAGRSPAGPRADPVFGTISGSGTAPRPPVGRRPGRTPSSPGTGPAPG